MSADSRIKIVEFGKLDSSISVFNLQMFIYEQDLTEYFKIM